MSRVSKHNRLKVLFLPAWYPSAVNPIAGIFVKEHAKAASLYNDVVVLYAYPDPYPQCRHLCRVSEDIEDGIRTIRVKYSGIPLYLWRKVTAKKQETKGSSDSQIKASILGKILMPLRIVVGDFLYYWSIFFAFRTLLRQGWKPDIIHAHVYTAGLPAVILGRIYKIPVIITEHTTNVATHSLTSLEQRRLRFAMKRAKIVLPVSEDLKRAIEDYYGVKSKFSVVPNVVNTKVFSISLKQAENKACDKKRMLTVCILTPRKGIAYLLEALSQIKEERQDFVLDIVGDGPNRSEYEQLARNLGLDNIVKFHGGQPEIVSFMQSCNFFVLPSLYENFGVVYIEAMACGKPVIATNAGGPSEIVNEDVGTLVPPKDVKALREAIEYMLDNYQNYSSEKIAQYARQRFGYAAIGKTLDEVYREVLREQKEAKS